MRCYVALLVAASMALGLSMASASGTAREELYPTGKLRVGLVLGPAVTMFAVTRTRDGRYQGIAADLAEGLAERLGVATDFKLVADVPQLAEAISRGAVDVGFMPILEDLGDALSFAPPYYFDADAFLVLDADIDSMLDLSRRSHTRIVGLIDTLSLRRTQKRLYNTTVAVASVGAAIGMLRSGTAHAFVLTHDSLRPYLRSLPGSHILDAPFLTGISAAVPSHRAAALAFVREFIEDSKRNGLIRRAFDKAGRQSEEVAPPQRR
jgi:polar amino acid transport system substrate-binding protein